MPPVFNSLLLFSEWNILEENFFLHKSFFRLNTELFSPIVRLPGREVLQSVSSCPAGAHFCRGEGGCSLRGLSWGALLGVLTWGAHLLGLTCGDSPGGFTWGSHLRGLTCGSSPAGTHLGGLTCSPSRSLLHTACTASSGFCSNVMASEKAIP